MTQNTTTHEARMAVLESSLAGIRDNLSELKDLMVTVIRSQEHIATLQRTQADQEKRLRTLELAQATGRWTERIVWLVTSTAVLGYLNLFREGK